MKIQTTAKISAFALLTIFALVSASPATAFAKNNNEHGNNGKGHNVSVSQNVKVSVVKAKDNDNDGDENKGPAQNSVNTNINTESCWRAFGHFIAPGWIKHNGLLPVNANCFLPFGIAKKLGFRNGTTTPPVVDTTAPVITGIVVNTGVNNATVNWHTNESSDSKVYWSTINPLDINASTTSSLGTSARVFGHQLNISGLSASTTYYAVVASKDQSGNVATSSQFSFTTEPVVVVLDTTAPTLSSVVAVVGTSTINVAWMTNENATGRVYYSTSTPVATSSASFVENTGLSTSHLLNVTLLATSTTYHLLLESKDSSGNAGLTTEFSATTGM